MPREAAPRLERHWTRLRETLSAPALDTARRESAGNRRPEMLGAVLDEFGIHALLLAHQAELNIDQMAQLARQREQTAALKASYRSAARQLRIRIAELESHSAPREVRTDSSE